MTDVSAIPSQEYKNCKERENGDIVTLSSFERRITCSMFIHHALHEEHTWLRDEIKREED